MGKKSKANTSIKSEDSNTSKANNEVFIKNVATGYVYQMVHHLKDKEACLLRTGNKFEKFKLIDIRNGLVSGKWTEPNVHEVRKFIKEDNIFFEALNLKMVNRVLFSEVLIEIDGQLEKDFLGDKYMVSILEKSQKQLARVMKDSFEKMYNADKTIFFNFLNTVERIGKKISKLKPHELIAMENAIDQCIENPERFIPERIMLTKVNE